MHGVAHCPRIIAASIKSLKLLIELSEESSTELNSNHQRDSPRGSDTETSAGETGTDDSVGDTNGDESRPTFSTARESVESESIMSES
jgi:hypothetical protein